jgi:hypothetical protein
MEGVDVSVVRGDEQNTVMVRWRRVDERPSRKFPRCGTCRSIDRKNLLMKISKKT